MQDNSKQSAGKTPKVEDATIIISPLAKKDSDDANEQLPPIKGTPLEVDFQLKKNVAYESVALYY